jgi:HD-like signal output (HDOD) protein
VLAQKLCAAVNGKVSPRPGMAYLAALLHNFGYLLLGHLFPQEFALLNRAATKYPDSPIIELENTIIGATHMELGVWLMQAWNMPDEITISIREHHNEHYHDLHCVYPNLVLIANRLLAEVEIGDEKQTEIPSGIKDYLQLDEDKVKQIFEDLMSVGQGLDYMALQMAA